MISRAVSINLKHFCLLYPGGLGSSVILGDLDHKNYTEKLLSFLDPVLLSSQRSGFVRCWHAKTDGSAASIFHENCDGKGPTMTIIKYGSYIFGGYTDVSWRSSKYLSNTFLAKRKPEQLGKSMQPASQNLNFLKAKSSILRTPFMIRPKIWYSIQDLTVKSYTMFQTCIIISSQC